MNRYPKVSDAEWSIMKILWEKSPRTSAEIIEALRDKKDWSPKTVQTLIKRLAQKGAVSVTKGDCYSYSATVNEDDIVMRETKDFIKRVFDGSSNAFIAQFIKAKEFSQDELDELRKILNEKD